LSQRSQNIVPFATKESHEADELDANILAVISNHNTLKSLVDRFDIPFFHIDAKEISRVEHEKRILEVLEEFSFDYIVLAKYMRILTSDFVSNIVERFNIHIISTSISLGAKSHITRAYN